MAVNALPIVPFAPKWLFARHAQRRGRKQMKVIPNTATTMRSSFASAAGGFVSTPVRHEDLPRGSQPGRKVSGKDTKTHR